MTDYAKLIDRAEKLLEKGKPELALVDFRAAIELQPKNEQLMERTADLSLSIGQLGAASDLLRRLFSQYIESRQLSNATVSYRKLQRLKALDPEVVNRYAELLENTSRRDAAEAYRVSYQEFLRLGDPRRALPCISRSLELDPRLEDYREQARICEALHEPVLAATALVHLGVMLERLGQDASDAYARAYNNNPNNMAARLGHGRALIAQQHPAEAIELLRPLATYPSAPEEAREPYALALLAVGNVEEAEPFVWGIFERKPDANLQMIHSVISGLIDRKLTERALALARRLEEFFRKAGRRNQFMQNMVQLAANCRADIPFFEYLAELYNSANRELEYSQMLGRLFDLYIEAENFSKALDALDRAVDIDPYEAEHKGRMQQLAGHAPEERLQLVAKRLGVDAPVPLAAKKEDESSEEAPAAPNILEDLILQAEIFLQYDMRDKALEKINQIKQSFPVESESDPRSRKLLLSAGLPVSAAPQREQPAERKAGNDSMVRAAEVSRLIARQNDPRSVLVTAVNQIGMRWQYSRCLAALAKPGKAPSLVVEYCSPDVPKSERHAMVRLLALAQRISLSEPVFRAADVHLCEPLVPIHNELATLAIQSLVVVSLISEDQPIGLMIVQQCGVRRRWSPDDLVLLRSMADQIALAVHSARMRSLVSTIGVAEEKTGLLKRSAYVDAVVAELGRQQAGSPANSSLALLQVTSLTSESPDMAVTELVRTLRTVTQEQAMSFRYDRDTVALLLPSVGSTDTEAIVMQVRDALETIGMTVCAGVAQAGPLAGFGVEDAATEWINRVARALTLAASVPERLCILPAGPVSPA